MNLKLDLAPPQTSPLVKTPSELIVGSDLPTFSGIDEHFIKLSFLGRGQFG